MAAVSIDGKIAQHESQPSDWTSSEDKAFLHEQEDLADVIIVGRKTYELAVEPLSKRNVVVFTSKVNNPEERSASLVFINPEKTDIQEYLRSKDLYKVLLLGGRGVHDFFYDRNLIDELYITIEPIIFGKGIGLFGDTSHELSKFKLESTKQLNEQGSILLHYVK